MNEPQRFEFCRNYDDSEMRFCSDGDYVLYDQIKDDIGAARELAAYKQAVSEGAAGNYVAQRVAEILDGDNND